MTNRSFESGFARQLDAYVALNRAKGLLFKGEESHLRVFDAYLKEFHPDATALPKSVVAGALELRPNESAANRLGRVSAVRGFCRFLAEQHGTEAWIVPKGYYPPAPQYVPHIYTAAELRAFFSATDRCAARKEFGFRHLVMPELYRLLFSCGLRRGEAVRLRVGDVDLEDGVLTIRSSKNEDSRLVPIAEGERSRLRSFSEKVHANASCEDAFFPGVRLPFMSKQSVYDNFRLFLWEAGIPHTGDGPRVHDFRHSFCVYRLRDWAVSGKDLLALAPVLSKYLGHRSFTETAYYFRLTADVFPIIRSQLEAAYADIIPGLEGEIHLEEDD